MHIINANIFLPDGRFRHGSVYFTDIIEELGEFQTSGGIDAENGYLLPGLFDVHTHGAVGFDFSDGVPEQLPALARHYARNGVTSFLATTMTLPEETLTTAVQSISAFVPGENEASCMGVHLEGPFLSRAKCGAQNPAYLQDPDIGMFRRINAASGNRVRLVDVAPELPGALDFIREASKICTVSLAHSAADYDTAVRGYESGATEATHLFNGMPPFHHRNPGVVGAAIDKKAYAEIISDGIHLHPAVVRAAFALFPASAMLISDSLRCAGMPEGTYTLGGQEFTLKDGRATLRDGTIAGSRISLLEGLQNAVRFGVPLETAVAAATIRPAFAVRCIDSVGVIATGRRADLVLLDRELNLRAVFLRGHRYVEDAPAR